MSTEHSKTQFKKAKVFEPSAYIPVKVANAKDRRQCVSCRSVNNKIYKSWYKCKQCDVFLCPDAADASTECWTAYHFRSA